MKSDLGNDIKNMIEDEVIPEDRRYWWLLSVWESTSNGRYFFPGIRFPAIYSLMQHDGIRSTVIIYVQGIKLGRDTNSTED